MGTIRLTSTGRPNAVGEAGRAYGTKHAARAALRLVELPSQQMTAVSSAIGRATRASTIFLVRDLNGDATVRIVRRGRNGYQVMESRVSADGTKIVVQMAYDSSGTLVHYDPKLL